MSDLKLDRLKQILSVPTFFRKEHKLLRFLVKYLKTVNYAVDYTIDEYGNLYIIKGVADVYPCVCAHTDSVQPHLDIQIHEVTVDDKLRLVGMHEISGVQGGIGADDKAGVFVCLELLEVVPAIKVALFAGEEFGCVGSYNSDTKFFKNVGYVIEFDCPGACDVTHYCNGVPLFDKQGTFYNTIKPILTEMMGQEPKLWNHPYTDVWPIKCAHPISCINIATGYYKYHTNYEYVIVDEVFNAVEIGRRCIEALGNSTYPYAPVLNEDISYMCTANKIKTYYSGVFETEIEPYQNILSE